MAVAQETSNESEIVQDVLDFVSSLPIICDLKYGIAANPSCPPEVLVELAADEDNYMRRAVAENPSCPPWVLAKLVVNEDSWVSQKAAMNPSCPIAEVMRLVLDKVYSRYR